MKTFENQTWLERCFRIWTTSPVQTPAWGFKNDFTGFCKWFLETK